MKFIVALTTHDELAGVSIPGAVGWVDVHVSREDLRLTRPDFLRRIVEPATAALLEHRPLDAGC